MLAEVYVDGASAGDPGLSGAGIYIKKDGENVRHSIPLGSMSNHEAEYISLIKALEICLEQGFTAVSVRTDSQLVEQAVLKRYVKKEKYQLLLQEVLKLADQFSLFFIKWIPEKQNKVADDLARKAIRMNHV